MTPQPIKTTKIECARKTIEYLDERKRNSKENAVKYTGRLESSRPMYIVVRCDTACI
jgi:hypothetical protein